MSESGNREAFLSTVSAAVGQPHRVHTRPIAPLPSPVPPVAYATAPDGDLIDAFASTLTNLGGNVRRVTDLAEFLDEVLATLPDTERVVLSNDPECEGVRALLAEREGIEILDFDSAATAATADIGFTGAIGMVALTGSIVVDAGRAGGRTASLLPPVHVALVKAASILATPSDFWRGLDGHQLPSNTVQITGPSRSADIELIITLGVHGPKQLWVGVLSEPDVPIA